MPRRTVDDNRGSRSMREVSKSTRNSGGKLLPRGYAWISKDDGLYVRNLRTGEEEKIGLL